MVEVIIHVGMRGAGGGALAAALAASNDRLRAAGLCRLDAGALAAPGAGDPVAAADALVARLREEGHARAVLSAPDWFQRIDALGPVLQRVQQRAALRILIWMRPARSWLDAQDPQGSPPDGFRDMAALVAAHAPLLRWTELFGPSVTLRPFRDGTDVLAEFGAAIGVALSAAPGPEAAPAGDHALMLARISAAAGFDIAAPATDGPAPTDAENRIALLERRLAAAERRHGALAGQLHRLAQPQLARIRDRLQLAIALDDPQTLYAPDAVTAEVGRLRDRLAEMDAALEERDRLQGKLAEMAGVLEERDRLRGRLAEMASVLEDRDRLLRREAELLSSTSWRVTAPLRAISRLLTGRRV